MTLADTIQTLDNKIKANQAQYDLEGGAVQISALSSKELEKCEHLTGTPGVVEQTKFEYSLLGKEF